MKRHLLLLWICTLFVELPLGASDTGFNSNWRFARGVNLEAITHNFDDSEWESVTLPHDWSIEGPFSKVHSSLSRGGWLPSGKGVYRKIFRVSADPKKEKVFLYFGGAYRNSSVYLNGELLGLRPFGYVSFEYDLTEHIDFAGENTLAVALDNSEQPGSRWYSGSGIYRDVVLKIRSKVHVPTWGLHVSTPIIEGKQAQVRADFRIKNDFDEAKQIVGRARVYKNGSLVAEREEILELPAYSARSVSHNLLVSEPKLWSPETPELYDLQLQLMDGFKVLDESTVRFGIREFEYNRERGFFLNGEWTKIKGVCLHHDGGPLGAAVQRRTLERQLEILKEMGCNAIRTGHTPFSNEFLDLCDEMGFLVMNDVFDEWDTPRRGPVMQNGSRVNVEFKYYAEIFDEWAERDLRDVVLRDRNHPSVFMWGIGAKVRSRMKPNELGTARRLTSIVSGLDSRPIMNGIAEDTSNIVGELKADRDLDEQRGQYPGSAVIVGECYSAQSFYPRGVYLIGDGKSKWWEALGYENDASFKWADRRGMTADEGIDAWRGVKGAAYVMGQFIWSGWDYLGETVPFGWPARSSSFAPIDLCGFPKDGYYFYQSQWTDKPMVHVFPHWNLEGQEGKMVTVYAFTNGDEVELFQDGKSLGKRRNNTDGVEYQQWNVIYQPGRLEAVALKNGERVASKVVETAGTPDRIELFARREEVSANGGDLIYVECSILDAAGSLVPHKDIELQFRVHGQASLVGTGNGSPFDHTSFQSARRKTFSGKCLAILKTTEVAGSIECEVTGAGVHGAMVRFESIKEVAEL